MCKITFITASILTSFTSPPVIQLMLFIGRTLKLAEKLYTQILLLGLCKHDFLLLSFALFPVCVSFCFSCLSRFVGARETIILELALLDVDWNLDVYDLIGFVLKCSIIYWKRQDILIFE